jgi:hypothetical protein
MTRIRPHLPVALERERPQWLSGLESPALRPGSGEANPWRLWIEAAAPRPPVEVEFDDRDALVRVGRHEQLFTWPSSEAEAAAREVLAYMSRILRLQARDAIASADWSKLLPDQRELLAAADRLLLSRGAAADIQVAGPDAEPHASLRLLLPPERRLDVELRVGSDAFELIANGARFRLSCLDFDDDGHAWVRGCLDALERLLDEDLMIRTHRSLFGRRVGAVHMPDPAGKGWWNGDLVSYLGWGRTRTFARWWSPA